MQKSSIKKFLILSMVLIGASAVTAAILPQGEAKLDDPEVGTDRLVASSIGLGGGGDGNNLTCVEAVDNDCQRTANSSTTTSGLVTSSSYIVETTDNGDGTNTTE